MTDVTLVKKTSKTDTDGGGTTTVTISTSDGHLLVAALILVNGASSGAPITSISDTAGNSWTKPSSYSDASPPAAYVGGLAVAFAYKQNADAVDSITFHYPSADKAIVVVFEFANAAVTGARHDSDRAVASSTPTISNPAHGVSIAAACTSSATSMSGGFTSAYNSSGNLVGYRFAGSTADSDKASWSPSQNGAAAIISFNVQAVTVTTATASLIEEESLTALASFSATASLIEEESLSAVATTLASQAEGSAVPTDQADPSGIPLRHGFTSYHWPSPAATQYDRYASLQDGQLAAGPYNADADVWLYRVSAGNWKTDGGLVVAGRTILLSDKVSDPTYGTTGTFFPYSNAQWPYVEIVCPPSEAIAVTLRVEAGNKASTVANMRFGVDVTDQSAGGATLISPSTARGPAAQSWGTTGTTGGPGIAVASERHVLGAAGEFAGLTGHTLRITPNWRQSSGVAGDVLVNSGRLTVEPLIHPADFV